jgi:hypothetical protein
MEKTLAFFSPTSHFPLINIERMNIKIMATLQMAIANIERVDMITEENVPRVFSFDTASDASAEAQISAGTEKELRIKNQILAQNVTEDIVKGFKVTFSDSAFAPEVFALIDGGSSTLADGGFVSYTAPTAGEVVERVGSTLAVYAAEKDYDGHTLSYVAFVFPHAKGSPASVSLKDGEFYSPSYTVKSRPSKGQSPLRVIALPSLPVIVSSAADLPASPVSGKTCVLAADSDIAGLSGIDAGAYAIYNGAGYEAV